MTLRSRVESEMPTSPARAIFTSESSQSIESGGLQLGRTGDFRIPRLLKRLSGDDFFARKLFGAFPVSFGLLVIFAGVFNSGVRLAFGSFRALDPSEDFLTLLLVERERLDPNNDLICANCVALFQFDAQHAPRNGGGDDKAVMRSSFAVFIDGDAHGAASGPGDFDKNRRWTKKNPDSAATPSASVARGFFDAIDSVPRHSLVFSTATKSRWLRRR